MPIGNNRQLSGGFITCRINIMTRTIWLMRAAQLAPEISTPGSDSKTVGRDNGAIPRKYRELIAIAVSATT
jgi:alkylhydroperoxidase/carboxymuconolactone decarboxylase family protein YurZ